MAGQKGQVKSDKSRVTGKSDVTRVICQEWLDQNDDKLQLYIYQMVKKPIVAGQKGQIKRNSSEFQEYKCKI